MLLMSLCMIGSVKPVRKPAHQIGKSAATSIRAILNLWRIRSNTSSAIDATIRQPGELVQVSPAPLFCAIEVTQASSQASQRYLTE